MDVGRSCKKDAIVGQALRSLPRDKVQILTKFGMRWDDIKGSLAFKSTDNAGNPIDIYTYAGKKSVIKECEDSLRRLEQPGITIALVGARNKEQAIQNAKAAYINLSRNEIEMIDSELEQLELVDREIPAYK
jgi:aryl-alcohol dehydrogenase-like predicted oxidoreductase